MRKLSWIILFLLALIIGCQPIEPEHNTTEIPINDSNSQLNETEKQNFEECNSAELYILENGVECEQKDEENSRDICYLSAAHDLFNMSYCQKIRNEDVQSKCEAFFTKKEAYDLFELSKELMSYKVCEALPPSYYPPPGPRGNGVVVKEDTAKCNLELNPIIRNFKYKSLFYEASNETKRWCDSDDCDNYVEYNACSSNDCTDYEEYSGNTEECMNIPYKTDPYRDPYPDIRKERYCYVMAAIKSEDPKICDLNNDSYKKIACYIDVTLALKNPLICNNIKDTNKHRLCVEKIAIFNSDPEICLEMFEDSYADSCILKVVGQKTLRLSDCDLIESEYYKMECVSRINQHKLCQLCNDVCDPATKERCINYFGTC